MQIGVKATFKCQYVISPTDYEKTEDRGSCGTQKGNHIVINAKHAVIMIFTIQLISSLLSAVYLLSDVREDRFV